MRRLTMDGSRSSSPVLSGFGVLLVLLVLQPSAKAQAQAGGGVLGFNGEDRPQGMLVTDVIRGGPADRAGLRKGDIIVQVAEVSGNTRQLTERIRREPVGVPFKITYLRGQARTQVDVSTVDRLSFYKTAAAEGSAVAQGALGDIYFNGDGVAKDAAEGVRWWRKAADQGYAEAAAHLGWAYLHGASVPKDPAEGVRWYRKAAEQGDSVAERLLGWAYFNGQGVPKDLAEGARWYRKAAEQGDSVAERLLGWAYFNGQGVPKDLAEGARWYRKAAEQGDSEAERLLGWACFSGQGVPKDLAEAARWYRKAAEQGNAVAESELGYAYITGRGVSKDAAEGVRWCRKAAEQGNAVAEFNLGLAYSRGEGVAKDPDEAVRWWRKAAEQGVADAEHNLGWAYSNGAGVRVDRTSAIMWYSLAEAAGNDDARDALLKLCPPRRKRKKAKNRSEAVEEERRVEAESCGAEWSEAERRADAWKAYLNRSIDPEASGVAAEQGGRPREALENYIQAIQSFPDPVPTEADRRVRERIIKLVAQLNPPPALPQDAIRHAAYAQAAVEEAQKDANPSHLSDAVTELQTSLRIAPWWAEGYFNLGSVLKRAQRPGEAAQALELYLLADPHAQNAQDVRMEIYKLQYEARHH
jgi:TPR repeat protein